MSDYIGSIITGYCNGYFGRDSYGDKLILATGKINGRRWVTVKESGVVEDYYVTSAYDIPEETFQEWLKGEPEEEGFNLWHQTDEPSGPYTYVKREPVKRIPLEEL